MPDIIRNPDKLNDDALLEETAFCVPTGVRDLPTEEDLKDNSVRLRF